jgi:hypothetical protein
MAESLRDQHPDCVTITKKFKRWQHHLNYDIFKRNKLILKATTSIQNSADNYGMNKKAVEP